MVPSVQAARMTYAAAPDALQGAVAAGILGCGSVILGASETAGRLFTEVDEQAKDGDLEAAAREAVRRWRAAGQPVPGYGHPLHKDRDPRVARLFAVAKEAGASLRFVEIAEAVERVIPEVVGKDLRLNVSAAIPAVLLGTNFPLRALRGVPILARAAGLIAHLAEEAVTPSGFALSYQATRELVYEGKPPSRRGGAA
jgi:citrate synthase